MTAPSPLAVAALGVVAHGASAAALDLRMRQLGAELAEGVSESLLGELASLGLLRVARTGTDGPEYVTTTLGARLVDAGVAGEAAVPLEELERLRTDLLSTIAHELRTPLTAVRTSTGLLLDPTSDPTADQRRVLLETIERNADRMQRIVGDILDLARFRSGTVRLQLRRFDASELAVSTVATIQPLAERRGQAVELEAPAAGTLGVFGDHRRLEQALLNLVSNAHRFAPDGGRISVAVAGDQTRVAWRVSDDGPGIPEPDQARLFERFFVGRTDRNAAQEGVGLGLPTALAIAQAHGGTIDVRSAPGQGSTFTLTVPAGGPPEDA